jgi:dTDP-4-dehydrorhamnose reductase
MKILITGINGLLGTELSGLLEKKYDISGIDIAGSSGAHEAHNIDLTDFRATYSGITKINPDLVIHTAALSNVDQCETVPDLAYRMNALATRNVALACQRFDSIMLYVSTDYVFSGSEHPSNGYTEFDAVNPVSVYGNSKYAGEIFVRNLLNRYYIARTSWLFGVKRANFVTQIAEALIGGKPVKTVSDMTSSPTNVKDLSEAIAFLIETNISGTYHVTNSGFASRYQIGVEIAKMMNLNPDNIVKIEQSQLKLPAKRPEFSAMRNYAWELNGFQPLRTWQESIKEFLKDKQYI